MTTVQEGPSAGFRVTMPRYLHVSVGVPFTKKNILIIAFLWQWWLFDWLFDWLIDWIEFYAESEIFQPCNGGDYKLNVISFEILKFPWQSSRASLIFVEIQWNGLLCAKRVVFLDTGHHLTSHPTDSGYLREPTNIYITFNSNMCGTLIDDTVVLVTTPPSSVHHLTGGLSCGCLHLTGGLSCGCLHLTGGLYCGCLPRHLPYPSVILIRVCNYPCPPPCWKSQKSRVLYCNVLYQEPYSS